jgi:hypothetical protein
MDDFSESCALLVSNKGRMEASVETITKRNSVGEKPTTTSNKMWRFSAGDADKLEKGMRHLPSTKSTRSLKDHWDNHQ